MIYNNGDVYEGEWQNTDRHGKGQFRFSDGGLIEGIWKNDVF